MKKHILLIIILIVLSYISLNNEYMTSKEYDVTLIDKVTVQGRYGRLYSVYKLEDGYTFDQAITPTKYSQLEIGQKYSITVRPFDIKQTGMENLLYFFLPVILASITVSYIFLLIFCLCEKEE